MKDKLSLWESSKVSLEEIWLLPFTSLLTPYLIFLSTNNYALDTRAPWIVGAGLVFVALVVSMLAMVGGNFLGNFLMAAVITLFLDIQLGWMSGVLAFGLSILAILFIAWVLKENFYKIINAMFAVFLVVTLIQILVQDSGDHGEVMAQSTGLDKRYPPRVIHLVFDEHIGIGGVPLATERGRALKERMLAFYKRYGFYLFGESFSHYGETLDSIPNMLNYSDTSTAKSMVSENSGGWSWDLLKNRYFNDLRLLGYRINVWESEFLHYCSENEQNIDVCNTYNHHDTKVMQDFDFFLSDQVKILSFSYIKLFKTYSITRRYYNKVITMAAQYGVLLPEWSWDRLPRTTALNSLKRLDEIWRDILSLPTGNFLFAHLLFPHSPFVARADCSIRKDIDTWLEAKGLDRATSRQEKYQLYFDQMDCLYNRLESLFEKMQDEKIWQDSLIILQGDHGSRLSLTQPKISTRGELTDEDLTDYYSTLFAVKLPGMNAAYSSERVPIEALLKDIVLNFGSFDELFSVTSSTPFVYLLAEEPDKQLTAVPYTASE